MKKILSFLYPVIFFSSFGGIGGGSFGLGAFAQTQGFPWAHVMGSRSQASQVDEEVLGTDMDEAGNTYILSTPFGMPYTVLHDGELVDGGSDGGFYPDPWSFPMDYDNKAYLLCSYNPQGDLRWKKFLISGRINGDGLLKVHNRKCVCLCTDGEA